MSNPKRRGIASREKAYPARHADGILDETVIENDSSSGQGIEVGRLDLPVAIGAQGTPAVLVGIKDQNVGAG